MNVPCVTSSVDSRKWNAAVDDVEPRLELQQSGTKGATGYGLCETNDSIVGNNVATIKRGGKDTRDGGEQSSDLTNTHLEYVH